jgi:hypothetical protein
MASSCTTWSRTREPPEADGHRPRLLVVLQTVFNYDLAADKVVAISLYNTDGPRLRRGVYAYGPQANAWSDPLPIPDAVVKGIKNGNFGIYDPELNVYFCYFASDSTDHGNMWVYRLKKNKKK